MRRSIYFRREHENANLIPHALEAGPRVYSMMERKSGYLLLGQLAQRTSECARAAADKGSAPAGAHHPVDNGTEFHKYTKLERATATCFYFAMPHHAWERGTNENTNGLIRQYLPKPQSMAHLTQHDCNRMATKLNRRPRKRLGFRTPEECCAR